MVFRSNTCLPAAARSDSGAQSPCAKKSFRQSARHRVDADCMSARAALSLLTPPHCFRWLTMRVPHAEPPHPPLLPRRLPSCWTV